MEHLPEAPLKMELVTEWVGERVDSGTWIGYHHRPAGLEEGEVTVDPWVAWQWEEDEVAARILVAMAWDLGESGRAMAAAAATQNDSRPYLIEYTLGGLRCLEHLRIEGMKSVEVIGQDFYHSSSNIGIRNLFPKLKYFTLLDMPKLVGSMLYGPCFIFNNNNIPLPGEIEYENCPSLVSVPSSSTCFHSLKKLIMEEMNSGQPLLTVLNNSPQLTCLYFRNVHQLSHLSEPLMKCTSLRHITLLDCEELVQLPPTLQTLRYLEKLIVKRCGSLTSNPDIGGLLTLRSSEFFYCHNITDALGAWSLKFQTYHFSMQMSVPLWINHLSSLTYLAIGGFNEELEFFCDIKLRLWNFNRVIQLPEWLGNLSSRDTMHIWGCKSIKQLPSSAAMRSLTKLTELNIKYCPLLEERCRKDGGEEWRKISHIPRILIIYSSRVRLKAEIGAVKIYLIDEGKFHCLEINFGAIVKNLKSLHFPSLSAPPKFEHNPPIPQKKSKTKKRKTVEQKREEVKVQSVQDASDPKQVSVLENPKQPKRTKSPGIRVIGARVYDSSNGKTCHQCRQKTLDFTADCKNMKNNKQCTMKMCHKCLLNRYGEKAEEVTLLDDWKCPKCRDICNCSFCMKKRGCKPTGILIHDAKASGFSSVSELLHVRSPKSLSQEEITISKSGTVASPKKLGKENKFNGARDDISESRPQKAKKVKDLQEKKDVNGVKNESIGMGLVKKTKSDNKIKGSAEICDVIKDNKDVSKVKNDKGKVSTEICQVDKFKRKNSTKNDEIKSKELVEKCDAERSNHAISNAEELAVPEEAPKKKAKLQPNDHNAPNEKSKEQKVILPIGNELTNVAELELLPEDIGNALQLIQFCYTFGEVLNIRKGQAESILRDMRLGRNRRGKISSLVQFKIQLLTLLRKDTGEESPLSPADGKNCWIHALKEFVSESEWAAEDLTSFNLDRTDTYDMLSSSEKLRLLVFLCDETLETLQVRNWMEEENLKFSEKKKEVKEKLLAAKEKEKLAKRKLQDEVMKAIIAKKGAPLSIAEHESLVSEMKAESERAHADILEAKGLVPKHEHTPYAVRIKPVFIDCNGHACWGLKGCNKSGFLRQVIQDRGDPKSSDKWFSYDEDKDVELINEYISFSR
ncbi:LOW QUALITY PROTEIN: hypothetical protein V2J09_012602 [Rumex salicifolius]